MGKLTAEELARAFGDLGGFDSQMFAARNRIRAHIAALDAENETLRNCDCVKTVITSKSCRKCGRKATITQESFVEMVKTFNKSEADKQTLKRALARAAYVAEHLLQQVPEFTGVVAPDGTKEDDVIAAQIYDEIDGWQALSRIEEK